MTTQAIGHIYMYDFSSLTPSKSVLEVVYSRSRKAMHWLYQDDCARQVRSLVFFAFICWVVRALTMLWSLNTVSGSSELWRRQTSRSRLTHRYNPVVTWRSWIWRSQKRTSPERAKSSLHGQKSLPGRGRILDIIPLQTSSDRSRFKAWSWVTRQRVTRSFWMSALGMDYTSNLTYQARLDRFSSLSSVRRRNRLRRRIPNALTRHCNVPFDIDLMRHSVQSAFKELAVTNLPSLNALL